MLRRGLRPWSRKGPDRGVGVDPETVSDSTHFCPSRAMPLIFALLAAEILAIPGPCLWESCDSRFYAAKNQRCPMIATSSTKEDKQTCQAQNHEPRIARFPESRARSGQNFCSKNCEYVCLGECRFRAGGRKIAERSIFPIFRTRPNRKSFPRHAYSQSKKHKNESNRSRVAEHRLRVADPSLNLSMAMCSRGLGIARFEAARF